MDLPAMPVNYGAQMEAMRNIGALAAEKINGESAWWRGSAMPKDVDEDKLIH